MSQELLKGLEETCWMIFGAGFLTILLGLPLSLYFRFHSHNRQPSQTYQISRLLMKATLSMPYIILMILIAPLTRWLTGSSIGCWAAMLPLTLACMPIFANLAEKAFDNVPAGLVDTALTFGASPWQIVQKILIPEAMPQLIQATTHTLIHLTGYTAISGALGSGGLGSIAIHQGYFALQMDYLVISVLLLFLLIQLIQNTGEYLAHRKTRR